jgi:hypothetical protein
MVRRISALWLVVLIALPFSAPFPTCDLSDVFGRAANRPIDTPAPADHAALDEATMLLVPPVADTAGRLKTAALSESRTEHSVAPVPLAVPVSLRAVPERFDTPSQSAADILRI